MENHAYAFIGYTGQEIERFEIPWDSEMPEKDRVRMEGPAVDTDRIRYMKETRGIGPGDVKDLELSDGLLKITIEPATTRADFTLVVGEKSFDRADFVIHTRTSDDKFERKEE